MKFNKKVLANGLTVLHEKRDVPVTTVMLAVKYGAAYETEEEKGIAHFMEHLCFKGTEKRDVKQIAEEVERVGGDLNAFTSEEITAYHVRLPSEHLGIAMDVVFDVFFNASFPEEEFEKEASVICEEIKMYRDNPRAHVVDKIKGNLYEKPFGMFIAGTAENVKGFSRGDLVEKHKEMYVPNNSILCVVGNNDFSEIIRIAEKSSVVRSSVVRGSGVPEVVKKNVRDSEKREGVEQTNLAIGFHFPCSGEKGRYVAEVFSAILGEGMSSKLFGEVREKRGLVYAIKSELDLGKNYGYMIIFAGTDVEKEKEVVDICLEEFRKMGDISEEELAQAKIQVVGNRHVESEGSSETAINLIMEEVAGDAGDYYEFEERIGVVELKDIKKLAGIVEYALFSLGP
ncbi:MAG: insulinase family protein [Nanoarchaeota archaeon]|nr:insulinase family protein [Nanoarchaeota archaeon]